MNGKCPACGEIVTRVVGEVVPADGDPTPHHVMTYRCPHCSVVLGCQLDGASLLREIGRTIDDAFRQRGKL